MEAAQKAKEIFTRAIQNIDLPDFDPSNLSTLQRLMLGGKHPVEKILETIHSLPDEVIPHIIEVCKVVAKECGE